MKHQQWKYTRILQLLIIVAAYGYLAYRLLTFDGYVAFADYFTQISVLQVILLIFAFLLFPLNVLFESLKWRTLLHDIEPSLTLQQAQRQTYYGFVGAFFTPSRWGDYPSRALLLSDKRHWLSAVALGFVGSLLLVIVICVFGLPAMVELFIGQDILLQSNTLGDWHYSWAIAAFVFLLVLAGCLPQMSRWLERHFRFRKQQTIQMIHTLGHVTAKQLLTATAWSFLRYLTFCLQVYLVLIACDAHYQPTTINNQLILAISTYYLFITITPSIPVADVAIKGSWAIIIFSAIGGNVASITLATILIWIINTICPMLIGTLVKRTQS